MLAAMQYHCDNCCVPCVLKYPTKRLGKECLAILLHWPFTLQAAATVQAAVLVILQQCGYVDTLGSLPKHRMLLFA